MRNCSRAAETRLGLAGTCVALAMLLAAPFVLAQGPSTPAGSKAKPAAPTAQQRSSQLLDERVKVFAKSLDLNDTQAAAVKQILLAREQEMLRLRMDSSMSGSDRIAHIRMLQDQTIMRIRGVLNDEQKKKYDPLAVRRVQPAPDQRSVEDWLKLTRQHEANPPQGTANAH